MLKRKFVNLEKFKISKSTLMALSLCKYWIFWASMSIIFAVIEIPTLFFISIISFIIGLIFCVNEITRDTKRVREIREQAVREFWNIS